MRPFFRMPLGGYKTALLWVGFQQYQTESALYASFTSCVDCLMSPLYMDITQMFYAGVGISLENKDFYTYVSKTK